MSEKIILQGRKVKTIREKIRPEMTQTDLGDAIGKSKQTILTYEKGEFAVDKHTADIIAKKLKVNISDLQDKNVDVRSESKESGMDITSAFDRYDQIYKNLVLSKDQTIESKNDEIKRLLRDRDWMQSLIDKLTGSVGTSKKTE